MTLRSRHIVRRSDETWLPEWSGNLGGVERCAGVSAAGVHDAHTVFDSASFGSESQNVPAPLPRQKNGLVFFKFLLSVKLSVKRLKTVVLGSER